MIEQAKWVAVSLAKLGDDRRRTFSFRGAGRVAAFALVTVTLSTFFAFS
jgi:hypothetical protein